MNKYCRECGTLLVKKVTATTYDEDTGAPIHWDSFMCPKRKWWNPFSWLHVGISKGIYD